MDTTQIDAISAKFTQIEVSSSSVSTASQTRGDPIGIPLCGYYDRKTRTICTNFTCCQSRICYDHYIIWDLLSDVKFWTFAKVFFDSHIYCGFERDKRNIAYYKFIQKDKWDGITDPLAIKNDDLIVKIWNENPWSLFSLINPDGTNAFDPFLFPRDYDLMLRRAERPDDA